MKRPSQLVQLIWDYYREDPAELARVQPLAYCTVRRRWGVLQIRCPDRQTAEAVSAASVAIERPVRRLRLAQRVRVLARNVPVAAFSVPART